MTVQDRLDDLRARFDGCQIVALADLSTELVLTASTASKVAQEVLESLCREAKQHLTGAIARDLSANIFGGGMPHRAISIAPSTIACFVTLPPGGPEALCIVCDPKAPLTELMDAGTAVLADLGEEV